MIEHVRASKSFGKRVFFWGGLLLGAVLAFFVLLGLIAPKVINRDALRSRIETTISKELGGTVTYDRIDLMLLPRPDIIFHNFTVSVPGTASVSVDAVKIFARFIPLLQGRFAVSRVDIERPVITFALQNDAARSKRRVSKKARPAASNIGTVLAVASRTLPDLSLKISRGKLSVVRDGEPVLSFADMEAVLAFVPELREGPGRSDRSSDDHYHITGKAQAVISGAAAFPEPLSLSLERFDALPQRFSITKARARLLDLDAVLAGSVDDYLSVKPRSDITVRGSIGPKASEWLGSLAGLPPGMSIRAPLRIAEGRLRSSGTGTSSSVSFSGSADVTGGTMISFALRRQPGLFAVEKLRIKDGGSDAVLRLMSGTQDLDVMFTGTLTGDSISRIVDRGQPPFRRIAGDFRVHLPRDRWTETMAEGTLEGEGVMIASQLTGSFAVDRISAEAHGRTIDLHPLVFSLGPDILTAEGTAALSKAGVAVDLDVSSNRINIASLQDLLKEKKRGGERTAAPPANRRLSVEAELRLRAAAVTFPSYTAEAVAMTLSIAEGRTAADLERATICGIGLQGMLRTSGHDVEIRLEPRVRGGALDESIRCILPDSPAITGTYDLSGLFTSRGIWDDLLPSLKGNLDFSAKQGRILSSPIVKGIIAYLNSTSLLKDSHASLLKEGFPYETIALRGSIQEGVIKLQQGMIRSKDIHIAADGDIDLRKGTLALTVLAAPFTSMDRLLGSIPIVKQIAGNALIVVPVRVEGTFRAPRVKPLPVSGVGTNITNLMKNIVTTPFKIVEPILPGEQKKAPSAVRD